MKRLLLKVVILIILLSSKSMSEVVIGDTLVERRILPPPYVLNNPEKYYKHWQKNTGIKERKTSPMRKRLKKAMGESIYLQNTRYIFKVKKIEIVRVIPRKGNNPTNQEHPINNTTLPNGQVVMVPPDKVNQQQQQQKQQQPQPQPQPQPAPRCECNPDFKSDIGASLDFCINPNTCRCGLYELGEQPADEDAAFFIWYTDNTCSSNTFNIEREFGAAYQVTPATGSVDTPVDIFLTHLPTGKKWKITLKVYNRRQVHNQWGTYCAVSAKVIKVIPLN